MTIGEQRELPARVRNRWFLLLALLALVPGLLLHPVAAHEQSAPILDEAGLDAGLFVELRYPRVIRQARDFQVAVVISNLANSDAVTVQELRYHLPGSRASSVHRRDRVLTGKRADFRRFKRIRERLLNLADGRDPQAARALLGEHRRLLRDIRAGALVDRQAVDAAGIPEAGRTLVMEVEVDLQQAGIQRTISRQLRIPVQPRLPSGSDASWFAGDQHLHTIFSIDAFFLDGTRELVTDYATTAQAVGLDWIIITDHTNVGIFGWYRPWMFVLGELLAGIHRVTADYLVLQGQEMGVGAIGPLGEPAHLLVYPRTVDSTGFLPNPCQGLIANHVNCEPEQTIIDRVNDSGGIGFIAHPFNSTPLTYVPWNIEADVHGWAGMEIFNSSAGNFADNDQRSVDWWYERLNAIQAPVGGVLQDRPDYPTRFPVGLGNSDAHQPAHIGATFTYAQLPGVPPGAGRVPREALMDAFVNGRVVASNGPLVFARINGAGTGEVAVLSPTLNQTSVSLQTTPEFGPVGDYEITVLVNGLPRRTIPPSGSSAFDTTMVLDNLLAPPDTFVTIRAERTVCVGCPADSIVYQAIANPIWLEFPSQ